MVVVVVLGFLFFFGHNMMVEFCDYKLILVCFLPVTFKSFPVSETKIIIHIFIDVLLNGLIWVFCLILTHVK